MKMSKPATEQRPIHPGNIGMGRGEEDPARGVFKILFTCRKAGLEHLGQLRLDLKREAVSLEMFNESYFDRFPASRQSILRILECRVLKLVCRHPEAPEDYIQMARERLREGVAGGPAGDQSMESPPSNPRDLESLFNRLNEDYFQGNLQARIEWGRETKLPNRRTLRFGSFDARKNLIRIHPRLKQDFVPLPVLELTVYHEMCHQFLPPVKRHGNWQTHHRDFKKKEKEYRDYREAMRWEKTHWAKLLVPVTS